MRSLTTGLHKEDCMILWSFIQPRWHQLVPFHIKVHALEAGIQTARVRRNSIRPAWSANIRICRRKEFTYLN